MGNSFDKNSWEELTQEVAVEDVNKCFCTCTCDCDDCNDCDDSDAFICDVSDNVSENTVCHCCDKCSHLNDEQ